VPAQVVVPLALNVEVGAVLGVTTTGVEVVELQAGVPLMETVTV